MKKPLFIITVAFNCLTFLAQPIISGTGILELGSINIASFAQFSDLGTSGENQVWDFSSHNFTPIGNLEVIDPSTSAFSSSFPSANWVFEIGNMTSYFEITSQEMNNLALNITQTQVAGDFSSNPRKILEFPFEYLNSFNDSYSENGITSSTTVTYNGYGTLIMPNSITYTNVSRVTEVVTNGEVVTRYFIQSPFMNIASHFSNTNMFAWIQVNQVNSINENQQFDLNVYPNPSSEKIALSGSLINDNSVLTITGLDGRIVKSIVKPQENQQIDISSFSPGWYYISNGYSTCSFLKMN
jgi:hypothetical protein